MKLTSVIPTQLFEIPGCIFINKNRDVGTHGGVPIYIKDGIPFIRRTDLDVHELECIWVEQKVPWHKKFPYQCIVSTPVYIKISPYKLSGTSSQLTNQISSENKETMLTGDFNINYQKADDNGELKSIFTLFQLK